MKSIYEFTKILSVLFLLSGIGFIFSNAYLLAIIGIAGFLIIRLIDSDWMFDTLQLDNPNTFVVTVSFIILLVYGGFIYQEMKYDPLLTQIKPEHKNAYIDFENKLYEAAEQCIDYHNTLQIRKESEKITAEDVKKANRTCVAASSTISKVDIPQPFSGSVKALCENDKNMYKKLVLNLSSYNYSGTQDSLIQRIKDSQIQLIRNQRRAKQIFNDNDLQNNAVLIQF